MKKLFCFLLILAVCLSFTGCDKSENKQADVDIEYFAALGQIPECKFMLGDDPEVIKNEFNKLAEENDDNYLYVDEGENNGLIDNGTYNFYYKKNSKDKGIDYLISYDTAYGFKIGTICIEIKDALGDIEYAEEPISSENAFFLMGANEGTVIKCEFEKNTVMFVFTDNALCATAIYTNDWE